jgi:oligoendopeptidase F
MAMSGKQSKLEVLKKKQEQLKARIQKVESLEKSRERKRDTRRKILVGSYFIDKANEEGSLGSLYQQMESYLKRNSDRELFQLVPLVEKQESVIEQSVEA